MPHDLTWYAVGEALQLDISGNLSVAEMHLINQQTIDILAQSEQKLVLLIDASGLTSGYLTADQLRSTQRYKDHPNLDALVIVASSKLNRLITLLAFNLALAPFLQFSSKETAKAYMIRRGFSESSVAIHL